jgi:hypothetical protein
MCEVERHGEEHFESFQLFTTSLAASTFYEALGYAPVQHRSKVTHARCVGA